MNTDPNHNHITTRHGSHGFPPQAKERAMNDASDCEEIGRLLRRAAPERPRDSVETLNALFRLALADRAGYLQGGRRDVQQVCEELLPVLCTLFRQCGALAHTADDDARRIVEGLQSATPPPEFPAYWAWSRAMERVRGMRRQAHGASKLSQSGAVSDVPFKKGARS
jgi:hypothetical protein